MQQYGSGSNDRGTENLKALKTHVLSNINCKMMLFGEDVKIDRTVICAMSSIETGGICWFDDGMRSSEKIIKSVELQILQE